jgi:hypothetical protein
MLPKICEYTFYALLIYHTASMAVLFKGGDDYVDALRKSWAALIYLPMLPFRAMRRRPRQPPDRGHGAKGKPESG